MHEKVLTKHGLEILRKLKTIDSPYLENWVLAGGTGLALQLGHRISDDFDLFRTDDLDLRKLHKVLPKLGSYETLQESDDTLTILAKSTKISFFRISDPFVFDTLPFHSFQIAAIAEIALMKLVAISSRGSRKDFVDLYTIARGGQPLGQFFELLPKKYASSRINAYHILKSLTYFEDAEVEPMPSMLVPFDWEECKAFFIREATRIVLE